MSTNGLYDTLLGQKVKRVEYVSGAKRDNDSGYVIIEFESGCTLYADAPTLYGPQVDAWPVTTDA